MKDLVYKEVNGSEPLVSVLNRGCTIAEEFLFEVTSLPKGSTSMVQARDTFMSHINKHHIVSTVL